MAVLIIPALIALLTYANVALVRRFEARRAGRAWWAALWAAWLAGSALGVYSGFFFEYQASPRLRVFGAPVPAAVFHWEGPPGEEQWVDFVTPAPALFAASNVAFLGLLAGCAVGLAYLIAGPPTPPPA